MSEVAERTPQFRRNDRLEELLREINALLGPVEARATAAFDKPRLPVVMVVGAPRAGTTMLMQWLADSGAFGYPSNLLSRFWAAPFVGARIQRMLTDPEFDYGGELADLSAPIGFESRLGKTKGALSPNEFWYFWRRFLPNVEPRLLSSDEEAEIDAEGFARELAALEVAFEAPFAMKAMIMQYNIPALARIIPTSVFFHIVRDPFGNLQSLLEARRQFYGTEEKWYSAKPPEFEDLVRLSPIEQVAGQVHYTNRSIGAALAGLPEERRLAVRYEDFCRDPARVWDALRLRVGGLGAYRGPASFDVSNRLRVGEDVARAFGQAWQRLTGEPIRIPGR